MNDMSITQRLKQLQALELTRHLAALFLENYFFAFSDMLGDGHFDDVYNQTIKPLSEDDTYVCKFLSQIAQHPQRAALYYQILIEPFAAMKGEIEQ